MTIKLMPARLNNPISPCLSGPVRLYRDLIRWLHARSFVFSPEHLAPREGLVAAVTVTALVCVAYLCHQATFGWAAFAAFWTMLIDPGQTYRLRIRAMLRFVWMGGLLAGCMSYVASVGLMASAAVLFTVVFLCTAIRYARPYLAQVSVLLNVVAVVAVGTPQSAHGAPVVAGDFLVGGGIAIAAHIVLSRAATAQSPQRALSAVFRTLGDMADDLLAVAGKSQAFIHRHALLEVAHRAAVREAIEVARARIRSSGVERTGLSDAVDSCDRIFASLVALSHIYQASHPDTAHALEIEVIAQLRSALREGARRILRRHQDGHWARTSSEMLKLKSSQIHSPLGRAALSWSDELHALSRCAFDARPDASIQPFTHGPAIGLSLLDRCSPHALRMACTVVLTLGVAQVLHLAYAYWATMAVVVVMQPGEGVSFPRMLERIIGSMAGAIGAAAVACALTQPWQLFALVFLAAGATVALRSVNYTLYVIFLTPLFVWVNDLLGPGLQAAGHIALARATDNVLGSILCLCAWLVLGASRGTRPFRMLVADAMEANLQYAALVCTRHSNPSLVDAARCRAGLASNEAEACLRSARLEGRYHRHQLDSAEALLVALRRLAGAAAFADLYGNRDSDTAADARSAHYLRLSGAQGDVFDPKAKALRDAVFTMDASHPVDAAVLQVACAHRDYQLVMDVM